MTLAQFVGEIISFINTLVGLLASAALVIFLWGSVRFLYRTGDTHAKAADRSMLTWGLVSLFVLVSVMGIVKLMQQALLP
ncbi:MAG TPA: hypothetical protein VJJ20_02780 [Candidatus Paceibacterota bacterium]